MSHKTLSQTFCLPPSSLSRTLQQAESALFDALHEYDLARIQWPSCTEQKEWGNIIHRKANLLCIIFMILTTQDNRFGFVDGKNYSVESPTDVDKQNAFYNGWLHSTLVTGVLCFGANGTIIWAKHNCPGSWNDSENSRELRRNLKDDTITLDGYGVVADSAFPVGAEMHDRIITPMKQGDLQRCVEFLDS
jgi:hypothetical protein